MRNRALRDYLESQSTDQLSLLLRYCLTLDRFRKYENTIKLILAIFREREKDEHYEISPEMRAEWERFLADEESS